MQLAPNVVVAGRFRLNRLLGRGGMGSVWHATHLGLDIPCAVKFIEGEFAHHPEAQTRFEREAKAAAQLRSPHVVQILDHGVWENTPYIAMELLDGEDLGKRLAQAGRLSPAEVTGVITQVCRALAKAHGAGIVHRDLKPDNIFLVKDDDREIAKVLDFGIAKANNAAGMDGATKTGAVLGTPYYMSPEQARGAKTLDSRADLWALAVIVFQCLTGHLPFEGEALGELFMKIMVEPIPMPSSFAPDLPQSFDQWWTKAAAREPSQRFQTAKEFAESLSIVLGTSQMTDVMDRAQMRAALASLPQAGSLGGSGMGSSGMSSSGTGLTNPQLSATAASAPAVTALPHGATQAGMARTFGDGGVAGVPKRSPGLLIGALSGVVLALVGVTAVLTMRKGDAPTTATAAAATEPTTAATPTASAAPAVAAPAAASAQPSTQPSAHPSAERAAPEHATAERGTSEHGSTRPSRTSPREKPVEDKRGSGGSRPTPTSKPAANDLGF